MKNLTVYVVAVCAVLFPLSVFGAEPAVKSETWSFLFLGACMAAMLSGFRRARKGQHKMTGFNAVAAFVIAGIALMGIPYEDRVGFIGTLVTAIIALVLTYAAQAEIAYGKEGEVKEGLIQHLAIAGMITAGATIVLSPLLSLN